MRFALLLHYQEMTSQDLGPERLAGGMRAFKEYARALDEAGVLANAEVLAPSSATTTVSRATGELVVTASPLGGPEEPLAGVFLVDVADLDAAIEWADRAPSAVWGYVEVRPVATRYVDGAWLGEQPVQ